MDLHPDCAPLSFLLGTWKGSGQGSYPTIDPFSYVEEVNFAHVGKPFLSYTQKTRHAETMQPLHAETGYMRCVGGAAVEFIVVQPSGIIESHQGTVDGHTIEFELEHVHTTATAKSVSGVRRSLAVNPLASGSTLTYDIAMAAVGQPLTHHLHAELVQQMPS